MNIIGITGGVGAGKSQILQYLKDVYGAYVIQADQVGHRVMEPGQEAYKAIAEAFGTEEGVLRQDGTIDRGRLGSVVFADPQKLQRLNAIVHPAVKTWIRREIARQRQQGCRLLIIEAALLIEDHYEEICGELWYIHTNAQIRRQRLKDSRGYSDEKVDAIFQNQLSEAEFRGACQAVIDNSGSFDETAAQIRQMFVQRNWI